MSINIEIYCGKDTEQWIDFVADLRIVSFREFPYLYQGTMEYEKNYLRTYSRDPEAMIAIARKDDAIAGILTGIPLIKDTNFVALWEKLVEHNLDPSNYYYCGEGIVLPEFRAQGVLTELFIAQDVRARSWGYSYVCALTVKRDENHPLCPDDYVNIDRIITQRGFRKTSIKILFPWPTIQVDGSVKEIDNEMEFWIKKI